MFKRIKIFYNNNKFEWWLITSFLSLLIGLFFKDNLEFIRWTISKKIIVSPFILTIAIIIFLLLVQLVYRSKNPKSRQGIISKKIAKYFLTNQRRDDHIITDILEFEKYSYTISFKPVKKTNYFRCGIKLSNSKGIPTNRISPGSPLIHLTKNNDSNLYLTIYDADGQWKEDIKMVQDYNNAEIFFEIVATNDNTILRLMSAEKDIYQLIFPKYSYGKIMGWGDGNNFEIKTKVYSLEKI